MIWRWSVRRWLVRLLGIDKLEREIQNLHDQKWQFEKLVGELTTIVVKYQAESVTRQSVMRNELMESESRLMTRIEELEDTRVKGDEDDTLPTEDKKAGYTRWTERKRARAAADADPTAMVRRLGNGTLSRSGRPAQDDVRRGNDQPSDGEGKAPEGEGKRD